MRWKPSMDEYVLILCRGHDHICPSNPRPLPLPLGPIPELVVWLSGDIIVCLSA